MQEPEPVTNPAAAAANATQMAQLLLQRNQGAGWFFAIALFSVINLVLLVAGGGITFLLGLGITQIVDVVCLLASEGLDATTALVVRLGGAAITVTIAGVFVLFGALARRGQRWAFPVGMTLYALDGLILLALTDWLGLGFHIFALLMLFGGLRAQIQIDRLAQPLAPASDWQEDAGEWSRFTK
jgi:hypothetical protein